MAIIYGGVTLPILDRDSELAFERHTPPLADVVDDAYRQQLDLGERFWAAWGNYPPRSVRINRLYWPAGASRWAVGHFLATEGQLATLRPLVYDPNITGQYKPLTLTINDGANSISAPMWLLPPRPLQQIGSLGGERFLAAAWPLPRSQAEYSNLYLLTLVDDRYFWWQRHGTITVSPSTTWADLYQAIATNLGITITAETVDAKYLKPSTNLQNDCRYLPPLLDTVAYCCGQRIVRKLDGTVLAIGPTTARDNMRREIRKMVPNKEAGGLFAFGA